MDDSRRGLPARSVFPVRSAGDFFIFATEKHPRFIKVGFLLLQVLVAACVVVNAAETFMGKTNINEEIEHYSTVFLMLFMIFDVIFMILNQMVVADERMKLENANSELAHKLAKATRSSRIFTEESAAQELVMFFRKYSGSKYWIITETGDHNPNSEQMRFSAQLERVLALAGWSKAPLALPLYCRVSGRGILLGYRENDPRSEAAAGDMLKRFSDSFILAMPDPITDIEPDTYVFQIAPP